MRNTLSLNTKWFFAKGIDEPPASIPDTWYIVNLPHTWNGIDGSDGGGDYYRGSCCYARYVDKTELPDAGEYFLEINGANSSADVYVNGKRLAHHDGGYSTWRVDITDALEDKNLLAVLVDNGENDRVYPQQADFTFYGGLYRNVNLICTDFSHFELEYYGTPGIKVTPVIESGTSTEAKVEVDTWISHPMEGQEIAVTIKDAHGSAIASETVPICEAADEADHKASVAFDISGIHRWNGKSDPYLYTAEAALIKEGRTVDKVSTRFGLRTFEIDPERGFVLNGKSYPLHGVSRHQDRPDIGNALLPCHHQEDMDLILEMGANTIRLAHYQHDQYFYDLCDEAGLVVWAEIPYISSHMPKGRENTISQMKELIIQNYNHPSIVVWGLSNEISMQGSSEDLLENHRILNDLAHEMDPYRKTTVAVLSSCDINDPYLRIPDVISYNHYYGWYGGDTSMNGAWFDDFHAKHPDRPVGMSEYGCEALDWHTSDPKQGDYTEEYQAYYHEELIKQLFTRPFIWATHVWNMFDFGADNRNEGGEGGQNHKGLVTFDRKYKKDSFYAYKAWLSDEPFVHICGKRYVDRTEDATKVAVYSNQPEVELFVNGSSVGRKTAPDHFFYFNVPNAGESILKAVAGGCTDESLIRKVETPNEAYILKEKGAILNWFDITAPKGYFSLNDTIDDVMQTEEGNELILKLIDTFLSQASAALSHDDAVTTKAEDRQDPSFTSPAMRDKLLKTAGSFTLIRLANMTGIMGNEYAFSKETLLQLNARLNAIAKPQN